MDELFIYDRDKGLFKKLLEKSFVIEGRYQVSASRGQDINSNNFDTLVPELKGQKYPVVVCLAPKSVLNNQNGQQKEDFTFSLLFLCSTYYGQTGVKDVNPATRTSTHEVWYDWKDMKQCAADFIQMLDKVTRRLKLASGMLIAAQFNIDTDSVHVWRLSRFNEDRVSGVRIDFNATLMGNECLVQDYNEETVLGSLAVPDEIIHAQHKHK